MRLRSPSVTSPQQQPVAMSSSFDTSSTGLSSRYSRRWTVFCGLDDQLLTSCPAVDSSVVAHLPDGLHSAYRWHSLRNCSLRYCMVHVFGHPYLPAPCRQAYPQGRVGLGYHHAGRRLDNHDRRRPLDSGTPPQVGSCYRNVIHQTFIGTVDSFFERHHRFAGWLGVALVWIFVCIADSYNPETGAFHINGNHLARQQEFWYALFITLL